MKPWLLIVIGACLAWTATAQVRLEEPEMYVGLTAGAVGSRVRFNPQVEQDYQLGFKAGAAWRYITDKHFGLQIELNYEQRGWREQGTQYACRLDYAEMPFLTHLYFGKKVRAIVNIGPKIGYLVSEKRTDIPSTGGDQYQPVQNRFDYGICGGLGMEVHRPRNSYMLEARFNFGLGNIYSAGKADTFDASSHTNLSLNAGWLINVKK